MRTEIKLFLVLVLVLVSFGFGMHMGSKTTSNAIYSVCKSKGFAYINGYKIYCQGTKYEFD